MGKSAESYDYNFFVRNEPKNISEIWYTVMDGKENVAGRLLLSYIIARVHNKEESV